MSLDILAIRTRQLIDEYEQRQYPTKIHKQDSQEIVTPQNAFLTINEIWTDAMAMLETNEFFALSVVGPQGSGKTSIAQQFAKKAQENEFKLVYALPQDFLNDVDGWVNRTLDDPRARNCLILDDLSYSMDTQNRKNQAMLKNVVSRFRHIYRGQVFVIFITHRLHAAPPMLRNSGSWIFTNMQTADRDDAVEVVGKSKEVKERLERIYNFIAKVTIKGARDGVIKFALDGYQHAFKWGKKNDLGDGRLMAIYHGGELKIFNSKLPSKLINFDLHRYKKIEQKIIE